MLKIAKFGGTSLATAEQMKKVRDIINADMSRRIIVPSAPGKAHKDDVKITDLLLMIHEKVKMNQSFDNEWDRIVSRFQTMIKDLNLDIDLSSELKTTKDKILSGAGEDYIVSRGEAINGRILAALLGAEFVEAGDVIIINSSGKVHPSSYEKVLSRCSDSGKRYVIPGFYGKNEEGEIRTLSRGGSDVTGAVAANALSADLYENWTDVSGFMMTDPRIIPEAATIQQITYQELRDLAYMGAGVLHDEAIFPVQEKGIPINIRNTNRPLDDGTLILPSRDSSTQKICGISGVKGFTAFTIKKAMRNADLSLSRKIVELFESHDILAEHILSGIDTVTVVVKENGLELKKDKIIEGLKALEVDEVKVDDKMSLVAMVGNGMKFLPNLMTDLFSSLAAEGVTLRMIDFGSSDQNIIIGVDEADHNKAIKGIYKSIPSK
ncbi:aspartate kinase [Oceanispirochaeta crateris]|nr:aspartate kinase [Oceanispirochaeta crateris]